MSSRENCGSFFGSGANGNGNGNGQHPEDMDDSDSEDSEGMDVDEQKDDAAENSEDMDAEGQEDDGAGDMLNALLEAKTVEDELEIIYGAGQGQVQLNQLLQAVEDFTRNHENELETFFNEYEQFLLDNLSPEVDLDESNYPQLCGPISQDNADSLLHYAIRIGNFDAALYLIERGFGLEVKGKNNQTSWDLLRDLHSREFVNGQFRPIAPVASDSREVPAPQFRY